ncbi:hypothetical protein F511_10269 [Dorcoceras hygrometricum]|uniref:Uncharacterized protein n=1 Tax=Dorcoceras hygrometricum TaxID=472368 RepID=A0A2Z7A4B0_9LAMI|nr:hypothetical protein F511_10269 [Dorcoceras hygrometricum]
MGGAEHPVLDLITRDKHKGWKEVRDTNRKGEPNSLVDLVGARVFYAQLQKKNIFPAGRKSAGGRSSAVDQSCSVDEERSAGARRPAGKLNNDDVSSNVSNQQEATAQTSSWY